MDTQQIEIVGRSAVISQLTQAGIEVATPERDNGIDLIGFVNSEDHLRMIPMQLKCSLKTSFSIDKKYQKFKDILLVYVWYCATEKPEVFALTYQQVVKEVSKKSWIHTNSWIKNGLYSTSKASKDLCKSLEKYKMTPEKWKKVFL